MFSSLTYAASGDLNQATEIIPTSSSMHFASVNTSRSVSLDTSLRIAAREGRYKLVDRLIEEGADVNSSGDFGETALMYAARWNHIKAALTLLRRGADVGMTNYHEETALTEAAKGCSHRISSEILAKEPNANLTDYDGRTALIHAAMNGCPEIVRQLLDVKKISLNTPDKNGKTALDYAMEGAQLEVGGRYTDSARMIYKAGGKTAQFSIIPSKIEQSQVQVKTAPLP